MLAEKELNVVWSDHLDPGQRIALGDSPLVALIWLA